MTATIIKQELMSLTHTNIHKRTWVTRSFPGCRIRNDRFRSARRCIKSFDTWFYHNKWRKFLVKFTLMILLKYFQLVCCNSTGKRLVGIRKSNKSRWWSLGVMMRLFPNACIYEAKRHTWRAAQKLARLEFLVVWECNVNMCVVPHRWPRQHCVVDDMTEARQTKESATKRGRVEHVSLSYHFHILATTSINSSITLPTY